MAERETPSRPAVGGDLSRSYLAAERTLLAWWRSGLAALAVALAIGRLVPALIHAPRAPFVALGLGFGALAVTFIIYGASRQRHIERAMASGAFRQLDTRVILTITVLMVILVTASIVLIVFER